MTTRASFWRYWSPAFLWTAVVLLASSDFWSAGHSGDWLHAILLAVFGHLLPASQFNLLHLVVRKCAHLTEYAILSALVFRARRAGQTGWSLRWGAAAWFYSTVVATIDEWHQTLIPSRTGTFSDVILDSVGAALAQVLIRVAQVLFF